MTISTDNQGTSTRPYLLRALHDWCTDNGFTPYIAVYVDDSVQVPMEHVKNNEIVLNVGFEATSGLKMGNEAVEFRARFGGVARDIVVPVDHVVAIYARENGQGMAFPVPTHEGPRGPVGVPAPGSADRSGATTPAAGRSLRLAGVADDDAGVDSAGAGRGDSPADEPGPNSTPTSNPPPKSPPNGPPKGPRPALKRIK